MTYKGEKVTRHSDDVRLFHAISMSNVIFTCPSRVTEYIQCQSVPLLDHYLIILV